MSANLQKAKPDKEMNYETKESYMLNVCKGYTKETNSLHIESVRGSIFAGESCQGMEESVGLETRDSLKSVRAVECPGCLSHPRNPDNSPIPHTVYFLGELKQRNQTQMKAGM